MCITGQEKDGQVSYKAEVEKVYHGNKAIAHKIKSGNVASLAVNKQTQHKTCRCPDFQNNVMYNVGFKLNGKSRKRWQLVCGRINSTLKGKSSFYSNAIGVNGNKGSDADKFY